MSDAQELQRLRWQCRRGLLELDYLFEEYLDNGYLQADADERAQFLWLLDQQDPDLQAWIVDGTMPPPDEVAPLVRRLRKLD